MSQEAALLGVGITAASKDRPGNEEHVKSYLREA